MRRKMLLAVLAGGILASLWAASSSQAALGYGGLFRKAALAQQFDSTKGYFFKDDGVCAEVEAAIADQPLQVQVSVWTQKLLFNVGCTYATNTPGGYLGIRWQLDHWEGGIIWMECRHSDWLMNTSGTSFMKMSRSWSGSHPCGAGTYRVRGFARVFVNGTWHQGSKLAGPVYIN